MGCYPPGVTGNEYEIAGPDFERDEEHTCGAENVTIRVHTHDTVRILDALIADASPNQMGYLRGQLHVIKSNLSEIEMERCPFNGAVLVQGYQGEMWWECPMCSTEHRVDMTQEIS